MRAVVQLPTKTRAPIFRQPIDRRKHRAAFVIRLVDRHADDLHRRKLRRQHQPVVIAVRHDERADEPRRSTPRGRPAELFTVVRSRVFDLKRTREVLAQVMTRARLQGPSVLHHRFNRISAQRTGELLALGLQPAQHRDRHHALDHVGIDVVEDHQRLALGFLFGRVRRVPLLP